MTNSSKFISNAELDNLVCIVYRCHRKLVGPHEQDEPEPEWAARGADYTRLFPGNCAAVTGLVTLAQDVALKAAAVRTPAALENQAEAPDVA